MSATGIGASVRRKEDFRFITGQGQYTDDVTRPGETRAVFVRSPHAHAKIRSIDVSAAKKMPGVIDVLTHGGPGRATQTLVYKVYQDGRIGADLGGSAAQSVVLMAIVIGLTAIQFRYVEKRVAY